MRLSLVLLPLVLNAPSPVWADGFEAAVAASREGRHGEAAAVFHDLARAGDAEAAFNLALLFATGVGLPQNRTEAAYWAWRARLADVRAADGLLARIWPLEDTARRDAIAQRLEADFLPLAQSGDGAAMLQLAAVLTVVREKPDLLRAHAWQSIAAALDVPGAVGARDATLAALPAPDKVRAQDEALIAFRDWCIAQDKPQAAACRVVLLEPQAGQEAG
ncbi:sel1 repeat family protein [Rhodobacter sp. ETT8]|uniref:Sel1 repeat family protein n=1 Tax=Pseudotabrizicola algicola TaxID=2709381 RepID=A0A6B3RJB0_9RHOB|nr:sel1 repeat family protein [Pseudotabrizicola algicola]